jgi:hypothetical protein
MRKMTPAKMFKGDLWVLASHAVQMAQNAYKNGQAEEREACALIAEKQRYAMHISLTSHPVQNGTAVGIAAAIRARGEQ